MLSANSRQTVRSKSRTGKYTRQLRSPWTDAWQGEAAPEPLPMPLQGLVSGPPLRRIDKLAESGHAGARQLATYWVGQGCWTDERLLVRAHRCHELHGGLRWRVRAIPIRCGGLRQF